MEIFISSMLDRLLVTSVQSAVLAAVVWLLCRPVLRLSPATQCWLWWLVALQALLGLCVEPIRLPWLPHAPEAAAIVSMPVDQMPAAGGAGAMPVTASAAVPWQSGLLLLWAAGFSMLLASTVRQWLLARRLLKHSVPCADARSRDAVVTAANVRGLRTTPCLRVCSDISSPMVVGLLHPVMLLPAGTALCDEELEMAVAHELEHLRRADLWLGLVPVLARHCFFFHPLMHVALREYGIAREAACDAAVVQAGDRSRHRYGELLLRLGTATAGSGLAAASPTFRALSRRLALLQHSSFAPRAGSVVLLLVIAAGVVPLRLVAAAAQPSPVVVAAQLPQPAQPQPSAVATPRPLPAPMPARSSEQPQRRPQPVRVANAVPPDSKASYAFWPDVADYYPGESSEAGEQGLAKIRLCYDQAGLVTASTLVAGTGFARLDDSAVRMGWQFRMKPAVVNGVPRADCMVVPVRFSAPAHAVKVASATPADSAPRIAFMPDAGDFYPAASGAAGEEGMARLRLCYDTTGKVNEATVAMSTGFPRLDDAAVRVGRLFRVAPAVVSGTPQPGCIVAPVRFSAKAGDSAARYTGQPMTANFKDMPVAQLLQVISQVSGRRIVVDSSVTGSITLRLDNVPWDQVLDIVVRTKGLLMRTQADEIVISAR